MKSKLILLSIISFFTINTAAYSSYSSAPMVKPDYTTMTPEQIQAEISRLDRRASQMKSGYEEKRPPYNMLTEEQLNSQLAEIESKKKEAQAELDKKAAEHQ